MRHNHSAIDDPDALSQVMARVSDGDGNVRSTYIGADNRARGQLAGFILGPPPGARSRCHPFRTERLRRAGSPEKTSLLMDNSKVVKRK
jgi:hypothetical protein